MHESPSPIECRVGAWWGVMGITVLGEETRVFEKGVHVFLKDILLR